MYFILFYSRLLLFSRFIRSHRLHIFYVISLKSLVNTGHLFKKPVPSSHPLSLRRYGIYFVLIVLPSQQTKVPALCIFLLQLPLYCFD